MADFQKDVAGIMKRSRFSSGKGPEKSCFSQTCSLLSQYLKENGGFGDLRLGIEANFETKGKAEIPRPQAATMMKIAPEKSTDACSNVKSFDLFAQSVNKHDFSSSIRNAPMTVLYAGKVLVFDEVPADKAMEIMAFASKASSIAAADDSTSTSGAGKISFSCSSAPSVYSNLVSIPTTDPSDMPIARKASLHRFLAKRKDRFTANTPYQINKHGKNTPLLDLNL